MKEEVLTQHRPRQSVLSSNELNVVQVHVQSDV